MKFNRHFLLPLAVAVYLNYLPAATADNSGEVCAKTAVIGVVIPLSAGAVSSGTAVKRSIEISSEQNDPKKCVRFVFEDDQMTPKNTVTAVNKLLTVDGVDGLIIYGTPTSLAVTDLVERKKIPLIALSILGKVVEGRTYVVKHWCTAERLNSAVTAEVKKRGYKQVAIVSMINDAMLGLRDLYRSSDPASTVLDEEFAKDNTDFGAIAVRIAAAHPDAVYVLLFPPQVAPFMKRLRGAGYNREAFGVHNLEDPNEIKAAAGAMDGMWLANGDGSKNNEYLRTYSERYGGSPALGGADGYDSAKLFIEAVMSGGNVNDYLHKVKNFSGVYGIYNATGKNDFDFPAAIKTVHGDNVETLP